MPRLSGNAGTAPGAPARGASGFAATTQSTRAPDARTTFPQFAWSDSITFWRDGADWAVYRAIDGRARKTMVEIGANNGAEAEVLSGLSDGDEVILYPGGDVADGVRVKPARTS